MQIHLANVHAIEQDMAALNVVEAQQELNDRGLAGAGVSHDRERLTGFDAEGNVSQDPVFVRGICPAGVREPYVAEFDFAARGGKRANGRGRSDRYRLVEQLKHSLGSRHGRLQDIEFFAEILNRPEETLRVHHE